MTMTKVVVVGAGIAGLGAAYALQQVGGRMRSMEWNGAWIDLGAEFIATPGIDEALLDELGILEERLAYPGGEVSFNVWRDGKAHQFNYSRPTGILRFGGMTWWEKLQMLRMLPAYWRQRRETAGTLYETWRGAWADDESVEEWLSTTAPGFLEYVVEPMFELYCGWEPHNLSKGAFLSNAMMPTTPTIWTFREGLGTVPRALAARLDVTTGAKVTMVDLERDPAVIEWSQGGTQHSTTADAVVIAVPGSRVLDFTRGLTPERVSFFEQVRYVPHELPFFTVTEPPPGVPDGVFFPRKEDAQIAAIGYNTSTTNPDVHFLRVSMKTGHIVSQLDKSDSQDLDAILAEAERRYPGVRDVVKERFVSRWREAIPAFGPGALGRLAEFVALEPQPRVAFAGDYLVTATTAGAYVNGRRAATELLERLG